MQSFDSSAYGRGFAFHARPPEIARPFCSRLACSSPQAKGFNFIVQTMNLLPSADETLEPFFNGKLQIIQKKKGYRFSVDPVLLSQFVRIRRNERVIDLGTGCGILPLLLSQKATAHSCVGVEIQQGLIECAEKNVALNHLEDRISMLKQDFRELRRIFPPGSFDVALSNPPYQEYRTGRINPSMEKAIARHEIKGKLEDLISIASYLVPPKGRCYLIFPALRTIDLFVALRNGKLEPKRIQFVHPRMGEEAKFILTESLKASGVELKIMSPLILDEIRPFTGE
ncbi:MAG TPA: tRNA1(Val) (adenine(37)-N6)-methyltransferase [Thermodesulfobacteriota bacterium]|nr:tRNA1(Val) (adenine(37)-N6)-methyltransferase [Thermodesulfobacteriota bacterium]